jgi:hypothetical protein
MVLTEIVTGLSGVKTALDILKGLKKSNASASILTEIADLQSALIEVQQGLMAANQTHTADIDRIRELEEEVIQLKAWDGEKDRYELKNVGHGAMVYALKPDKSTGEPPHWLCANCYNQRKKSWLNPGSANIVSHQRDWDCPVCRSRFSLPGQTAPQ